MSSKFSKFQPYSDYNFFANIAYSFKVLTLLSPPLFSSLPVENPNPSSKAS